MEHFIDIYKKKNKQEYCESLLNNNKIKVNLKVDGKPFQVLYNEDTDELEWHGRSGNETTIGPLIDDYTRLFSKPVNDAIAHIEPRKEVFKNYKFLTFEVIDNLLLLTAIIDKNNNFINDASEIKKIANQLDTDVMPTLWEGKFNNIQKESILQVISTGVVPEKQAFIDWVTTLFGSYNQFPKKLISASEDFIEGIVFFFDIDGQIIEYKIVDPTYRQSMKDRDNQHAIEREKRKEYYELVYNLLTDWLSKNAKKLDSNQIISLQKNFIELSKDKKIFNKLLENGKHLENNTSETYTVQVDRVLPEIKELLKTDGCKNVFELYMKTFYKEKKRSFIISQEFQTKINKIIKIIKEHKMMTLNEYIIQESFKDKIKSLKNKFKKEKVSEKVYKEEDLLEYKDKEITLEDGDKIFDIYTNTLPYHSDRTSELEKNAFKQGLFDYAWCNYSREVDKNFRFNEFGDDFADSGYSRANHESGYDWNEVGVGMMFMEPFFWGWKCAKKLNLKYNSTTTVKLPLNRFAK